MNSCRKRALILPVRRKLMAAAAAYFAGILLAAVVLIPPAILGALCAVLLAFIAVRLAQRKSVLLFMMAFMLLLGSLRTGAEIRMQDRHTAPGVQIEGTVTAIEKPYRVRLSDVTVNGVMAGYYRDVIVTLMLEEAEEGELPVPVPPEPRVGQRVSGKGRLFSPEEKRNPGGRDQRISALCEGYELSGYLLPEWTASGEPSFSLTDFLRLVSEAVKRRISALFGLQAALFQGILLGDRSALGDEVTAAMRLTGTAHILTVSGLHLSLTAGVMHVLLSRFSLRRWLNCLFLGVFLFFFAGLTGWAAGTVRALIMTLLSEYAIVRGRRYEPLTALSFAALVMTMFRPLWFLSASFQFSFYIVLVIQLFSVGMARSVSKRLGVDGRLRMLLSLFAVCFCAQIGSVPMQLMFYGYIPVLSLPMNLLCSMLMPVLLLGGWCAVLVSLIWFDAGVFLADALSAVSSAFERFSLYAASSSFSVLRLPSLSGMLVLAFLVLMLLLSERIRYGRARIYAAVAAACVLAAGYLPAFLPKACYVQLDVGQGDAALIRNGRRAVLIDVGPLDSYDMLRYLRHEGLFVDALILSHLDEDHAGALSVLLSSEIEIPVVYMPAGAMKDPVSTGVLQGLDMIAQKGISLCEVDRGDTIACLSAEFIVLSPDDTITGSNARSLLLYTQVEGISFLTTGDLPKESEPEQIPKADVLKVAHHGSRFATSEAFLMQAAPSLALISVGADNRYGHPTKDTLAALEAAGVRVLRTDRDGCITLRLDDGSIRVQRYAGCSE